MILDQYALIYATGGKHAWKSQALFHVLTTGLLWANLFAHVQDGGREFNEKIHTQ
jgi:hypothetical protein